MSVTDRVSVEMRDGIGLATRVYQPGGQGASPVILLRTPYGDGGEAQLADRFVDSGFVSVVQQVRGTGDSGGSFSPVEQERTDAIDAAEWVVRQPWYDADAGIGVFGMSYLLPASLSAIANAGAVRVAVDISGFADLYEVTHRDGVGKLHHMLPWTITREYPDFDRDAVDWDTAYRVTPPSNKATATGHPSSLWEEWCSLSDQASQRPRWSLRDIVDSIDVPMLHVTGWYDICRGSSQALYDRLSNESKCPQQLIIGPWHHHNLFGGDTSLRGVPFGDQSRPGILNQILAWFTRWLCDDSTEWDECQAMHDSASVSAFDTGAMRWREFDAWPPSVTSRRTLHLTENHLAADPLLGGEVSVTVAPEDPSPTAGGSVFEFDAAGLESGPVDRSPMFDRTDTHVWTTEPLRSPTTLAGEIGCELAVSSDEAPVTLCAKILDVDADGAARVVSDGITTVPRCAGDVVSINCWSAVHTVSTGHRIGLEVTPFDFPRYMRVPSSGGPFELRIGYGREPGSRLDVSVLEDAH